MLYFWPCTTIQSCTTIGVLSVLLPSAIPPWLSEVINFVSPPLCRGVNLAFLTFGCVPRCICLLVCTYFTWCGYLFVSPWVSVSWFALSSDSYPGLAFTSSWYGFVWVPHWILLSVLLGLLHCPISFCWHGSMLTLPLHVSCTSHLR